MKDDLNEDEYNEIKDETIKQLEEFQLNLIKYSSPSLLNITNNLNKNNNTNNKKLIQIFFNKQIELIRNELKILIFEYNNTKNKNNNNNEKLLNLLNILKKMNEKFTYEEQEIYNEVIIFLYIKTFSLLLGLFFFICLLFLFLLIILSHSFSLFLIIFSFFPSYYSFFLFSFYTLYLF